MSLLANIQLNLNAPKSQTNKFGGYKYRNCEDILAAVKPLLNGSVITINDDIVMIGDRIYVKATATISLDTDSHSVSAYAREPQIKKGMDESQITGAASSYARKYALNGLLLIDDTKDADSQNNSAQSVDYAAALAAYRNLTSQQQQAQWPKYDAATQKYISENFSG